MKPIHAISHLDLFGFNPAIADNIIENIIQLYQKRLKFLLLNSCFLKNMVSSAYGV